MKSFSAAGTRRWVADGAFTEILRVAAIALAVTALLAAGAQAAPPAGGSAPSGLNDQLKTAVQQAQSRLGPLEPWQKSIFEEEVIPQYNRFIRDYRPGASGETLVDVDMEILRRYVAFSATKALKRTDYRLLVYLRADPSCQKCMDGAPAIRALVKARAERRGFAPAWVTAAEIGDEGLGGREVDAKLAELAAKKGAAGALSVLWRIAPVDEIDTAHADERKFLVRTFLAALDGPAELKYDGGLELMESDPIEPAVSRLLTDAFTDFGGKVLRAAANGGPDGEEIAITVQGLTDYGHYARVRAQLQAGIVEKLKAPDSLLEERKIARGRATFVLRGGAGIEQLRRGLAGMTVERASDASAYARSMASSGASAGASSGAPSGLAAPPGPTPTGKLYVVDFDNRHLKLEIR